MGINKQEEVVFEIISGFDTYMDLFKQLTKKAPTHFRERNWDEMQATHKKRLMLYKDVIRKVVLRCQGVLLKEINNRPIWNGIKHQFSLQIQQMPERELAET